MNFQWLANPAVQFGVLVAGLFGPLVLFLYLKFEFSAERRKSQQSREALTTQLSEMESKMAGLRQTVTEMEERSPADAPGRIAGKRATAVRMHMRGQSAETIASGLKMPRSGVDLLLRIQELMKERTTPAV